VSLDLAALRKRAGLRDDLPPRQKPSTLDRIVAKANGLPDPAVRRRPKKKTRPAPRPAVPATAGQLDPYTTPTRQLHVRAQPQPRSGEPSVVAGLLAALHKALAQPVVVNLHEHTHLNDVEVSHEVSELQPEAEETPARDDLYP
jgi:hypothetical protein